MFTPEEKKDVLTTLEYLENKLKETYKSLDVHEGLQHGGHYDIQDMLSQILIQLQFIVDVGLE